MQPYVPVLLHPASVLPLLYGSAHTAYHKAKLTVAMRRLVQVHKVHIDRSQNITIELSINVIMVL